MWLVTDLDFGYAGELMLAARRLFLLSSTSEEREKKTLHLVASIRSQVY